MKTMVCNIEIADMATPRGSKQAIQNRLLCGKRQPYLLTQEQGLAGAAVNALTPTQTDLLARLEAQREHDEGRRA